MKRNLLIAILFLGLLSAGYSQDKIVTLNNDTIDCKIIRISHNTIFFDIATRGVKSSGKLPLNGILNYTISLNSGLEKPKAITADLFERFRLGINSGPGYLLSSSEKAEDLMVSQGLTADQAKSYYKDMKSGLGANADLTFLITPDIGAGIKYRFFDTSSRTEGFIDPQDGVHLIYTTYSEQIYVNYIGAMFSFNQLIGNRESFKLNSACSFGLTTYRNEAGLFNGYFLATGKNFGTDASIGLEYFITRWFSVGADLSGFYSSIRKMEITDGTDTLTFDLDKEDYENLTRLELSLGIRFYLWNR